MSGCLSCGGAVAEVADFGSLYLPDWVEPGESRGLRYPLRLVMCGVCTLVQLGDIVPRDAVIHERYGFASGLNEANVADLRSIAQYALQAVPQPGAWLDIGCNDGTLLSAVPEGTQRWGCDPLLEYDNFAEAARRNGVAHTSIKYFDADDYRCRPVRRRHLDGDVLRPAGPGCVHRGRPARSWRPGARG